MPNHTVWPGTLAKVDGLDPGEIRGPVDLQLLSAVAGERDMRRVRRHGKFVRIGAARNLVSFLTGSKIDPRQTVAALVGDKHRAAGVFVSRGSWRWRAAGGKSNNGRCENHCAHRVFLISAPKENR
jgi:hypothetical protein